MLLHFTPIFVKMYAFFIATPSPSVPSPLPLRSCAIPIFFCTFANVGERLRVNPSNPLPMKKNVWATIAEILRIAAAIIAGAIGGGAADSLL